MQNYTQKYIYFICTHVWFVTRLSIYIIRFIYNGKEKGCVKWIRIRYGQKGW